MPGPAVTIVDSGGLPVRPVESGAPVLTVADRGFPITLTERGAPFIVEGVESPGDLFASGEQGAWYDPSDLTTLFQDEAGTVPAVVGQTVALMLDKSGNDNHASQTTAANRPILRQGALGTYLEFDGVDDFLVTGNVDFTATDEMTVAAGYQNRSSTASASIVDLYPAQSRAFVLYGTYGLGDRRAYSASGDISVSGSFVTVQAGALPVPPNKQVLTGMSKISAPSSVLRVDGVELASSTADQGTGMFSTYPLHIGRRGGTVYPIAMDLYGLIVRGALSDTDELALAENWLNSKTGAY